MVMSDQEILTSYKQAKDRKAQIQILADLNATSAQSIRELLVSLGVDYRSLPRARKRNNTYSDKYDDSKVKSENGYKQELTITTTDNRPTLDNANSKDLKETDLVKSTRSINIDEILSAIQALQAEKSQYLKKVNEIDNQLNAIVKLIRGDTDENTAPNQQPIWPSIPQPSSPHFPDHMFDITCESNLQSGDN